MTSQTTIPEFKYDESTSPANYVAMYFIKVESLLAVVNIKHDDVTDVVAQVTGPIRARNYLMTICGDMMLAQIMATDGYATKTYAEIKTAMIAFFRPKNNRLNEYKFMTATPTRNEKFSEFAKRMRPLAAAIGIEAAVTDHRIMMQILLYHKNLNDADELRDKIMDITTTLAILCTWQEAMLHSAQVEKCGSDLNKASISRVAYDEAQVNQVRNFSRSGSSGSFQRGKSSRDSTKSLACFNCGGTFPHDSKCPAFDMECSKCHKFGHMAKFCEDRQKRFEARRHKTPSNRNQQQTANQRAVAAETISAAADNPVPGQTPVEVWRYVNAVKLRMLHDQEAGVLESCPMVDVDIDGIIFKHLADTGAQLNIMSSESFTKLKNQPVLAPSTHKLLAYHSTAPIPTRGQFNCKITINGITEMVCYTVLANESPVEDVLCYKTLIVMDVIRMVRSIDNPTFEQQIHKDFPSLFENRIGRMPNVQVHFDTDPTMTPVQQPAYDIPIKLIAPSKEKIDELIAQGVLEEVTYGDEITWISPMQPVMKGAIRYNGSKRDHEKIENEKIRVRITANGKCLNKAIVKRKRPMPSVHRLAHSLNGMKYYSVCDIRDAFSTVELSEECRVHTTFATPWGKLYRYCCLTMGLSISSEAFQDIMCSKTRDLKHIRVAIDDILVATETEEEHDLALYALLKRLVELNLTLNLDKCKFKSSEVNFFGMVLSKDGIKPNETKMKDFLEAINPRDKKECVSFLCLAQYFIKRIPKLAELSMPLRAICKPHAVFDWLPTHSDAIQNIKDSMIRDCLSHFDESGKLDTELWVDAGPTGVSGFLVQTDPITNDRFLISCMSYSFNDIELRYAQVEKEGLAALKACEHFYLFLIGQDFTLYTDNQAISLILNPDAIQQKRTPIRLNHWRGRLTQFSRMVPQFIAGEKNIADYLSRCLKHQTAIPRSDTMDTEIAVNTVVINNIETANNSVRTISKLYLGTEEKMISLEDIIVATNADETLVAIKAHISAGHNFLPSKDSRFNGYRAIFPSISEARHGIMLYNDLIIIPESLAPRVVKLAHRCHVGINSTIRFLQNSYFINGLAALVKTVNESCMACQATTNVSHFSPMNVSEVPTRNWHKTSMDFTSRLPNGKYIFVLKCDRSRYLLFKFSNRLTTSAVIHMLTEVFETFGVPDTIKSDNGPAFISASFAAFAERMGFKHQRITPIYPPANGGVERVMGDINNVVRCALIDQTPLRPQFATT